MSQNTQTRTISPNIDRIAVSVPDAALSIGVSESEIWRIIARGKLQTCKLGRRRLVLYESLKSYIYSLPNPDENTGNNHGKISE